MASIIEKLWLQVLRCKELRRLVRKWSPYYWVLMKKSVRKYKYISQILILTRKNKNNINVVFTFIVYFYKQCEDSGPKKNHMGQFWTRQAEVLCRFWAQTSIRRPWNGPTSDFESSPYFVDSCEMALWNRSGLNREMRDWSAGCYPTHLLRYHDHMEVFWLMITLCLMATFT